MNSENRLVVFGDSWGTGAWSTPEEKIMGGDGYFDKAWSNYFINIKNYSKGNYSLAEILLTVEDYFQHEMKQDDYILLIQTDPFRNLSKYETSYVPHSSIMESLKSMVTEYEIYDVTHIILEMFYFKLNVLGLRNSKKINVVGGCSDVLDRHIHYSSLVSPCKSWIKLLDKRHQPSVFYRSTRFEEIIENNPTIKNNKMINNILDKLTILRENSGGMFGYNNDPHPSKLGIDMLVNEIHNKLVL
jgi:hypothetical protein